MSDDLLDKYLEEFYANSNMEHLRREAAVAEYVWQEDVARKADGKMPTQAEIENQIDQMSGLLTSIARVVFKSPTLKAKRDATKLQIGSFVVTLKELREGGGSQEAFEALVGKMLDGVLATAKKKRPGPPILGKKRAGGGSRWSPR